MQTASEPPNLNRDDLGLPQDLGDGLVLRWGTPEDTDQLVEFNSRIHSREGQPPDESVGRWTRDLMRGDHPTTNAGDFTLVTDQTGKIISTLNLISQTWTYAGIAFGVGRPELVGTDPEYRRKGLVRRQFELIHRRSALRGEILQAITGIAWYYRQFGYEMTVNLNASRRLYWSSSTKLEKEQTEIFKLRPATISDIGLLAQLYQIHGKNSLISRVRNQVEWTYELSVTYEKSIGHPHLFVIEDLAGGAAGYIEVAFFSNVLFVREAAVLPGQNFRLVSEFLTRALKDLADVQTKIQNKEPLSTYCSISLGVEHPLYTALGSQLEKLNNPYAWYIRLPDLAAFLLLIGPALEKRLVESVMENYSGVLRLNFYRTHHTLVFEAGKLKEVGTYKPGFVSDGDAAFPDQTFLQLLLGYHSFDELRQSYPDLHPQNERAAILLDTLFPKRPSHISPLD